MKIFSKSVSPHPEKNPGYAHVREGSAPGPPTKPTRLKMSPPPNRNPAGASVSQYNFLNGFHKLMFENCNQSSPQEWGFQINESCHFWDQIHSFSNVLLSFEILNFVTIRELPPPDTQRGKAWQPFAWGCSPIQNPGGTALIRKSNINIRMN